MSWLVNMFTARKIAATELIVVICLGLYSWNRTQELKTAQLALLHPRTVEVVKTIKVAGPVRVVTKIVEKAGGERETTIEEERGEIREVEATSETSEPVSLSVLTRPYRTDRWLAGVGVRNADVKNLHALNVYGGYSFRNRLDLKVMVGRPDGWESFLMVGGRF